MKQNIDYPVVTILMAAANSARLLPRTLDAIRGQSHPQEKIGLLAVDGGSNQEELSYIGKPYIILRTHTERQDGLGENALLYGGDLKKVNDFGTHYMQYRRPAVVPKQSPSCVFADKLEKMLEEV